MNDIIFKKKVPNVKESPPQLQNTHTNTHMTKEIENKCGKVGGLQVQMFVYGKQIQAGKIHWATIAFNLQ